MKIAVTGASGFVGQNLSAYLEERGHSVDRVSLRHKWALSPATDILIHLAGKAHDTANTSAAGEYFKINTELTIKIFDEFLASDIRDFFFFSSVKACADKVNGILTEDERCNPHTPYGISKFKAEKYLLSQNLPPNKRLFIIRPSMIHGPGNKGNLNLLYKVVKRGIPWPLASFENSRSFISIDNLNYLIENMITGNVDSGIYNFADDKAVSTNQLVNIIAHASNRQPHFWYLPTGLVQTIANVGDYLKLPLNSERLKKLTESYQVSNQKIKGALRIESLPVSVEEGLWKTIKSFKK